MKAHQNPSILNILPLLKARLEEAKQEVIPYGNHYTGGSIPPSPEIKAEKERLETEKETTRLEWIRLRDIELESRPEYREGVNLSNYLSRFVGECNRVFEKQYGDSLPSYYPEEEKKAFRASKKAAKKLLSEMWEAYYSENGRTGKIWNEVASLPEVKGAYEAYQDAEKAYYDFNSDGSKLHTEIKRLGELISLYERGW